MRRRNRISGLKKTFMVFVALIVLAAAVLVYGERENAVPAVSARSLAEAAKGAEPTPVTKIEASVSKDRISSPGAKDQEKKAEEVRLASAKKMQAADTTKTKLETEKGTPAPKQEKIVYLTFDDGPSKLTDEVLSILEKEGIKATFFVLGEQAQKYPEVIRRISEAGHAIGNHTYDHEYDDLYSSFPRFWDQIKRTEEILREITGERPSMVRAPGGTYGHFDQTYFDLLEQGGYKVFDWNVDSGDSKRKGVPAAEIVKNATAEKLANEMIVLLHDGTGHEGSVKALPEIIRFYKKHGYAFKSLSPEQKPVTFSLADPAKGKKKLSPSAEWIETHVTPNAALFGPGEPLFVEAGGVETKLDAGEYRLIEGQYMVPLRSTLERLGARVAWDGESRTALIHWGDVRVAADPRRGTLASKAAGKPETVRQAHFYTQNGALWVSLRSLLESTGHSIVSFDMGEERQTIKAQ
ncbi:polysaccharide deacetylase family protein [Paenibacillus sp. DYY-L-2]|uniref:polysaccharide deacetylase n=1 Tax=Paenibacillus sp. DYY-L-2 TaxID=3447013 RepID=UPI003F4FB5FD